MKYFGLIPCKVLPGPCAGSHCSICWRCEKHGCLDVSECVRLFNILVKEGGDELWAPGGKRSA